MDRIAIAIAICCGNVSTLVIFIGPLQQKCIDVVKNVQMLKLDGCISISSTCRGLNVLRGSTVLQVLIF